MILIRTSPIEGGRVAISAPYDKRFIEVAHTLPGLKWDKKRRTWIGYRDSADILIDTLIKEGVAKPYVASMSVNDVRKSDSVQHNSTNISATINTLQPYDEYLYNYQRQARDFILTRANEGVILADGLGLGKTRTTLAAVSQLEPPVLIVCPSIVKRSWVKEGKALGIDVLELTTTKPDPSLKITPDDGIVVINYDIIFGWAEALSGTNTIVFDEGHNLCNSKSRRSTVCKTLSHNAINRIILTATPFSNKPIELWNIVDTISPGRFSSYVSYGIRYADGHQDEIEIKGEKTKVWNFKGKSHTDELNLRLQQFMIRRTKEDVALELPDKTRQVIELDVGGEGLPNVLPSDIDKEWMRYALSLAAHGKKKHAVELALSHIAEGSSVVIAAYRHEIANDIRDLLATEGIEPFMATGEKSIAKRIEAMEEAAKNQPSITIVTTHGVGEGINELTYANVVVIVELDYSPRWIVQFEGRFHRQGQKRNVLFQYLIGMGSLDEIIRDRIITKLKTFEETIGVMDSGMKDDLAGSANDDAVIDELLSALREMT